MKQGDSSQFELSDEVAKIRREIDALRDTVELFGKELSFCKEAIYELRQELQEGSSIKKTGISAIEQMRKFYLDTVSTVDIVRQVFVLEISGAAIFWTIVDIPPSEHSLLQKYNEELDMLNILKHNVPFDFHILNVEELSEEQQAEDIIPSDAELIWER